jgi:hypothetical protein
MSTQKTVTVILLGVVLSILAGCIPAAELKLNLTERAETVYKVVLQSSKDYEFVQPSINKTKERHTISHVETVFAQKIESIDKEGNATANITIKELRYSMEEPQGKTMDFNSIAEGSSSDPLYSVIGQSYKIKITPDGKVGIVDSKTARESGKDGFAKQFTERFFSDEDIAKRHQVFALMDAGKALYKKGDKWSTVTASPPGMLRQRSFDKVYTLTDIRDEGGNKVAVIDMNAVPSSKRAENMSKKEEVEAEFFTNNFEEKDTYDGRMILNLTTGEIDSYRETLRAEWFVAELPEKQKSDKGPDHLKIGFSSLYSIEKVD